MHMNYALQYSHTLMPVPALLAQVDVRLISYEQLMASIAQADASRIRLIAVAKHDTVEIAAKQYRHRVSRTVGKACIHHPLLMGVLQPSCDIATIAHAVGTR